MRLAILSDFHLGFRPEFELEEDCFDNAMQAITHALDCDVILIAGDIFDSRVPRTEVWAKALKILIQPSFQEKRVKLVELIGKKMEKHLEKAFKGIPIIAIHGTHERRGKGLINPIQALEFAGILVHLHCNGIILEKDGEKVAIFGMSGVPEMYAKQVLKTWNPKPVEDCFNLFMLHQNIEPFVYSFSEPSSLRLEDLPKGFDAIINGHVHTSRLMKLSDSLLILPGSTVVTQYSKEESGVEKGFFKLDTKTKRVEFNPIGARKFIYDEIELKHGDELQQRIKERLKNIKVEAKRPLISIKVKANFEISDKELRSIERSTKTAILRLVKDVRLPQVEEKLKLLEAAREKRLNIEELGIEHLKEKLKELGFKSSFDVSHILPLLCQAESEKVINLLLGEQKTLKSFHG